MQNIFTHKRAGCGEDLASGETGLQGTGLDWKESIDRCGLGKLTSGDKDWRCLSSGSSTLLRSSLNRDTQQTITTPSARLRDFALLSSNLSRSLHYN